MDEPLKKYIKITQAHQKSLEKLGIFSVSDILYHLPIRYLEASEVKSINSISDNSSVTLYGEISGVETKPAWKHIPKSSRAILTDRSGKKIKLIWFNQVYISKMYPNGSKVKISGVVSKKGDTFSMVNPSVVKTKSLPIDGSDSLFDVQEENFLTPIYKETKGITSNYISHAISKILSHKESLEIVDPIPEYILKKYNLPSLYDAFLYVHFPKDEKYFKAARKRFAFEEIFFVQIERAQDREALKNTPGFVVEPNKIRTDEFISAFPFQLTSSQQDAINSIFDDLKSGVPMSRLIEGDVGSGKTAVAAVVAHLTAITRPYIKEKNKRQEFGTLQVAYMAPTEILAKQHFENFVEYFKGSGLSIALITGSKCLKYPSKAKPGSWTDISKTQLKKWVANGEISVVIGTHALIQKNVEFKHLALCIIDEQHRFGVKQRKALVSKKGAAGLDAVPHLISMTATPIPRTLALTLYGDLDLTVIDQMPSGRKKVITEVVTPLNRDEMYKTVREKIREGRQCYVICPRIDEPDIDKQGALQVKSVEEEARRLSKNELSGFNIGKMHGKMKPDEKDKVMKSFSNGDIDVLVATSVVEVGVNVPNATVIIIEGAERFGLSQLHQLRGRVIRGTNQPYCFLSSDSENESSIKRLRALVEANDGFELAEMDLEFRGTGSLSGDKQWGASDIAMEAIKNIKLVEAAREEAKKIVSEKHIEKYPALKENLIRREKIHME